MPETPDQALDVTADLASAGREKVLSTERALAACRLAVVTSGTVLYPLTEWKGTIPWLAYLLLALAWVYGLYMYLVPGFQTSQSKARVLSSTFADAAFTMLWLYATGGYDSPFYVAMYLAAVAVAFRDTLAEALFTATIFAVSYLCLIFIGHQGHPNFGEVAVRITYLYLAAVFGSSMGRVVSVETTERVKVQERLQAEAERHRLAAESNERLLQADRYKDDFLSVMSHELRTPLNFITGFASLLQDDVLGPVNSEQRKSLGRILDGADRMIQLVNDLLDVALISAGKFRVIPEPGSLEPAISQVVGHMRPLAEGAGVDLQVEPLADVQVILDEGRVAQVVMNLVSNALKATPQGGAVTVRALTEDDHVRVEVTDTGEGIQGGDIPKLFQRFHQIDMSTTRRTGGVGLGLAICKAIMDAHQGAIGVESEPGCGSTFWFTLPLADDAASSGGHPFWI